MSRLEQRLLKLRYTSQEAEKQTGLGFRGPDMKEESEDFMGLQLLSFLLHEIEGVGLNGMLDECRDVRGYCSKYWWGWLLIM